MQLSETERLVIRLSSLIFLYEQKLAEFHNETEELKRELKKANEERKKPKEATIKEFEDENPPYKE